MFECEVSREALKQFSKGMTSPIKAYPAEYLALTNRCRMLQGGIGEDLQRIISESSQFTKEMLSLGPNTSRKPAAQLREEMMRRDEHEGYYFLEDHIDDMMEVGYYKF